MDMILAVLTLGIFLIGAICMLRLDAYDEDWYKEEQNADV